MTTKPRAGGKVKAWAWKCQSRIGYVILYKPEEVDVVVNTCGERWHWVRVEIRELPAVKSRRNPK